MRLNRLLLLIFVIALHTSDVLGQSARWQQKLKYDLQVSLNDKDHELNGRLSLQYQNNSPDTLSFIWFHLWPNAFKSDQTTYSEQQLEDGKTDFYFSGREQKGYINQLDFRSGNVSLEMEDHPIYVDVVKVILNEPLLPNTRIDISTPFHVKLPFNFSGAGHNGIGGQFYQVTNWYPKPAVYDHDGWHAMPYQDRGNMFSEFADFNVKITLPANYVVAATGLLQDAAEIAWLKTKNIAPERKKIKQPKNKNSFLKPVTRLEEIASDPQAKTLHYQEQNVTDFAFFADKYFIVQSKEIETSAGKNITAFSFYHAPAQTVWEPAIEYLTEAVKAVSASIGEYPMAAINIVEADKGSLRSTSYPGVILIPTVKEKSLLQEQIYRGTLNSWLSVLLPTNDQKIPWLSKGLNVYYSQRRRETPVALASAGLARDQIRVAQITKVDQALGTPVREFTNLNYPLVRQQAADWFESLADYVGRSNLDTAIKRLADESKFHHIAAADFKSSIEKTSGKDLTAFFSSIDTFSRPLSSSAFRTKLNVGFVNPAKALDSTNYISVLPVPGYNEADGFMIGAAVHNYSLPFNRLRFVVSPLYATRSKQLNGFADVRYGTWFRNGRIKSIEPAVNFARFSTQSGIDSNGSRISAGFIKFTPSVRIGFANASQKSSVDKWLEWKTYIIGETGFFYNEKESDGNFYPEKSDRQFRYINQLTFGISNDRILYPYDAAFQLQQGKGFYRLNLNAEYLLNYAGGGGLNLRLFGAKFGYLGRKSPSRVFETLIYQPKLTAVRGYEDYTYSNYFVGRQESDGLASQQIMVRDGGLKLRTDLFQDLQGRSDNWVASLNLRSSIPTQILPSFIPLKLFFDIGTYSDAWDENATGTRFLYVGGLQLSLFKDLLNIYAPLLYSKSFRDNFKTVPEENKLTKKISFSIDIQRFNFAPHKKQLWR